MEGVSVRNLMMVLAALMLVLAITIKADEEIYPEEATFESDDESSFEQLGWAELDESAEPERFEPKPIGGRSSSPSPRPRFGKKKMGCTKKCTDKCVKGLVNKVPVLIGYCKKSCNMQCELRFMDRLYKCTIECANSMPPHFKKDPKRAENYVEQCDMKCMK